MPDECSNCDYARPRVYGEKSVLECRVTDPNQQGMAGAWPQVKPEDWCGEYQVLGFSDPANWKVQGITLNTLTKTKVVGDLGYLFYVTGVDITNTSINKGVMVKLFDGNTENIIGIGSAAAGQSEGKSIIPPIISGSGEVWAQLETTDGSDVYIYIQGKKGRAVEVAHA